MFTIFSSKNGNSDRGYALNFALFRRRRPCNDLVMEILRHKTWREGGHKQTMMVKKKNKTKKKAFAENFYSVVQ